MMGLQVVTPAARQALSLQDAKKHLRVTHGEDDTYILGLIDAATEVVQASTNRQLITATLEQTRDKLDDVMELPRSPVSAVNTLKYIDEDGVEQTLATTIYDVDLNVEPEVITRAFDQVWPTVRNTRNAVTINFDVGYGADADTVPADIHAALKLLVAHLYETREPVVDTGSRRFLEIPFTLTHLMRHQKVFTLQ